MQEFVLVDRAMRLFEAASGCKLHRDPASKKCKFMPLARWRGTLEQTDIPCPYMAISDHLEMLGVELRATWAKTRKANGDIVQSRVATTCRQWKSGKFMELTRRSWSLNQYCLSKIWFRTHSVDLQVMDMNRITSSIKSWLYADQLFKPEEMIMFRPPTYRGLWVHNVKWKGSSGHSLRQHATQSFRPACFIPSFIGIMCLMITPFSILVFPHFTTKSFLK